MQRKLRSFFSCKNMAQKMADTREGGRQMVKWQMDKYVFLGDKKLDMAGHGWPYD